MTFIVCSEEFIFMEHMDAQHMSKYFGMLLLMVAILPLSVFELGMVIYEQQCHNRILINRKVFLP